MDDLEYAEYGQRVRAALFDSVLLYVVAGLLLFGFSLFAFRTAGTPLQNIFTMFALFVLYLGPTAYYTFCTAEGGQTIGKMNGHIAVRLDGNEDTPPGYVRSLIRAALPPFLWMLLVPGLLDVLWPLWDAKKQTLHDKLVGSVVVQV